MYTISSKNRFPFFIVIIKLRHSYNLMTSYLLLRNTRTHIQKVYPNLWHITSYIYIYIYQWGVKSVIYLSFVNGRRWRRTFSLQQCYRIRVANLSKKVSISIPFHSALNRCVNESQMCVSKMHTHAHTFYYVPIEWHLLFWFICHKNSDLAHTSSAPKNNRNFKIIRCICTPSHHIC